MGPSEYKRCPQCGASHYLDSPFCACGYAFQTQFQNQPPVGQPGVHYQQPPGSSAAQGPQTMAFRSPYVQQPTPDVLQELARRHKESNTLMTWTLIIGALCLWPLLIVTYLEYNKMRDIKAEIARMGVDVIWWERTFQTK